MGLDDDDVQAASRGGLLSTDVQIVQPGFGAEPKTPDTLPRANTLEDRKLMLLGPALKFVTNRFREIAIETRTDIPQLLENFRMHTHKKSTYSANDFIVDHVDEVINRVEPVLARALEAGKRLDDVLQDGFLELMRVKTTEILSYVEQFGRSRIVESH